MEAKRSPYEPHWSCLVCMGRHSVHICGSEWCAVVALGTIKLHDSTHSPSSCCSGVNPHWDLPWRRNQPFGKLSLLVAWWRACGTCMFVRLTKSPCNKSFSDHLLSVKEINYFSLWWSQCCYWWALPWTALMEAGGEHGLPTAQWEMARQKAWQRKQTVKNGGKEKSVKPDLT